MTEYLFQPADDVSVSLLVASSIVCAAYFVLTWAEVRRAATTSKRQKVILVLGAALSAAFAWLAMVRPGTVRQHVTTSSPTVVVLLDKARRLDLRSDEQSRSQRVDQVNARLGEHLRGQNLQVFAFGSEAFQPVPGMPHQPIESISEESDLSFALERLAKSLDTKPAEVVVVSDGRFVRPTLSSLQRGAELPALLKGTPIHTIDVGGRGLRDASILSIDTVGSAVAHQPLTLSIEVYCATALGCANVPVVVREHRKGTEPSVLARGQVELKGETVRRLSLEVTIERAGSRVLDIAIEPPSGDEVPENNRRLQVIDVVRERLRILHVAGRPTYDVRALRTWLKSDSSVDLVSFFILRTDADDTNADEDTELSLIPFPVDELFSEHLPSFDAVILEDIDAERYRLARYFENLAVYVEQGGGLLLVGGPSAFSGGSYAGSPLERVLPVSLGSTEHPFDTVEFAPRVTRPGRVAKMLEPLRAVMGNRLPSMPGANSLGPLKPRAVGLWEHPTRTALPLKSSGPPGPMPLLAVMDARDGRVVALGTDGTHRLAWGRDGIATAGRAYGALWDGLLGWVMRDKRFESTDGSLVGECIAGRPAKLRLEFTSAVDAMVEVEIMRLDAASSVVARKSQRATGEKTVVLPVDGLGEGAYMAWVRLGDELGARFDFACERGGSAWADPRPDSERLKAIAAATGGKYLEPAGISSLRRPEGVQVASYRQVTMWLRPWMWALGAALSLAAHWMTRRSLGLR